ncbi:MAG TPA: hypothetical protein VNH11_10525 [Pirellulales bacterium]|nr:hypothetical protein [Pirellulales bacterium]
MPPVVVAQDELRPFGEHWQLKQSLPKKPPYSSMRLGNLFDARVGAALATMLGNVEIVTPSQFDIRPSADDVVEVGPVRIVGGVRPQNFDVGYRPDGVRIAFDSKTLNDTKSVGKNYQNMINDLGTEATTVHTRFPYAVVAFMVIIPEPCLLPTQRLALTRTLERLTGRIGPIDSAHKAEAISLVLWNPNDGSLDEAWPAEGSPLRIESFSGQVERHYVERYKGLPPHDVDEPEIEAEFEADKETSHEE